MTAEKRSETLMWVSLAGIISSVILVWAYHGQEILEKLVLLCYLVSYTSFFVCLFGSVILITSGNFIENWTRSSGTVKSVPSRR